MVYGRRAAIRWISIAEGCPWVGWGMGWVGRAKALVQYALAASDLPSSLILYRRDESFCEEIGKQDMV